MVASPTAEPSLGFNSRVGQIVIEPYLAFHFLIFITEPYIMPGAWQKARCLYNMGFILLIDSLQIAFLPPLQQRKGMTMTHDVTSLP